MPGQWGILLVLANYSFVFVHFNLQCFSCCSSYTVFFGCVINYRLSSISIAKRSVNSILSLPDQNVCSMSLCSSRRGRKVFKINETYLETLLWSAGEKGKKLCFVVMSFHKKIHTHHTLDLEINFLILLEKKFLKPSLTNKLIIFYYILLSLLNVLRVWMF